MEVIEYRVYELSTEKIKLVDYYQVQPTPARGSSKIYGTIYQTVDDESGALFELESSSFEEMEMALNSFLGELVIEMERVNAYSKKRKMVSMIIMTEE